jgi:hypothetical protein
MARSGVRFFTLLMSVALIMFGVIESGPLAELDRSGHVDGLYAGQDMKAR